MKESRSSVASLLGDAATALEAANDHIADLKFAIRAARFELEGMGHSCGNSMRALNYLKEVDR